MREEEEAGGWRSEGKEAADKGCERRRRIKPSRGRTRWEEMAANQEFAEENEEECLFATRKHMEKRRVYISQSERPIHFFSATTTLPVAPSSDNTALIHEKFPQLRLHAHPCEHRQVSNPTPQTSSHSQNAETEPLVERPPITCSEGYCCAHKCTDGSDAS